MDQNVVAQYTFLDKGQPIGRTTEGRRTDNGPKRSSVNQNVHYPPHINPHLLATRHLQDFHGTLVEHKRGEELGFTVMLGNARRRWLVKA